MYFKFKSLHKNTKKINQSTNRNSEILFQLQNIGYYQKYVNTLKIKHNQLITSNIQHSFQYFNI